MFGGNLLRIGASWEDLVMNMWAVVYHGSSRTSHHNLAIETSCLAAPSTGDIRFVWVQNDALNVRVIDTVVRTVPGRQKRLFSK